MTAIKYYERGHNLTFDDGSKEKVILLSDNDVPISTNYDENGCFRVLSCHGNVILQTNDVFTFVRFPSIE